jgi:hypothetical protein
VNANDPNVALLEVVAAQLGEALGQQLVFVGGAVAGLLITDPAMPPIRSTQDVDVVCSVVTLADYYRIGEQLRERGFMEDACRHGAFDGAARCALAGLFRGVRAALVSPGGRRCGFPAAA